MDYFLERSVCDICWDEAIITNLFKRLKDTRFGKAYVSMASKRHHDDAGPLSEMLVEAHQIIATEFNNLKPFINKLFKLLYLLTIPLGMADGFQRSENSNGKLTLQYLFNCCALKTEDIPISESFMCGKNIFRCHTSTHPSGQPSTHCGRTQDSLWYGMSHFVVYAQVHEGQQEKGLASVFASMSYGITRMPPIVVADADTSSSSSDINKKLRLLHCDMRRYRKGYNVPVCGILYSANDIYIYELDHISNTINKVNSGYVINSLDDLKNLLTYLNRFLHYAVRYVPYSSDFTKTTGDELVDVEEQIDVVEQIANLSIHETEN